MDPTAPETWGRAISAAVVPVVMISACGLLCLAFYNRLAAVLARLRALHQETLKNQEELLSQGDRTRTKAIERERARQEVAALARQQDLLLRRSRLVRRVLFFLLSAIVSLALCSFAAGVGAFRVEAFYLAGPLFLGGLAFLLAAIVTAMAELRVALDPVELGQRLVERLGEALPAEPDGVTEAPEEEKRG